MKAYRVLAYLIAIEIPIQAAAIAFALFGLGKWVEDDGGVLNKAVLDAKKGPDFTGSVGFAIHPMNAMLIVALGLALLITSFFVKSVVGASKWAGIVFGLIVLQFLLGILSHAVVWLGPLHAINAFLILMFALRAARAAGGTFMVREASADVAAA